MYLNIILTTVLISVYPKDQVQPIRVREEMDTSKELNIGLSADISPKYHILAGTDTLFVRPEKFQFLK